MIGESLSVSRGETDRFGTRATTTRHTITGVIAWGTWSRSGQEYSESAEGDAELFAVKGVDLRPRDRVARDNGQVFAVVAGPHWTGQHPLTGRDFGRCVFTLKSLTG